MFVAIVTSLLVSGLLCLWIALINLSRLAKRKVLVVKPPPKKEETGPRLTRLGRPIEPVQI